MHLPQCLHQSVDVWNAGTREPRRRAGSDGTRCRADRNEWLGDRSARCQSEQASHQQGQQGGTSHRSLGSANDFVNLLQPRRDAYHARASGYGDIEEWAPHCIASTTRHAPTALKRGADLGALAVILQGGQRCDWKVAVSAYSALRIDQGDAVPYLPGELMDGCLPRTGIPGQRLADKPGFVLQGERNLSFEVPA
jgi:hypothetical protein